MLQSDVLHSPPSNLLSIANSTRSKAIVIVTVLWCLSTSVLVVLVVVYRCRCRCLTHIRRFLGMAPVRGIRGRWSIRSVFSFASPPLCSRLPSSLSCLAVDRSCCSFLCQCFVLSLSPSISLSLSSFVTSLYLRTWSVTVLSDWCASFWNVIYQMITRGLSDIFSNTVWSNASIRTEWIMSMRSSYSTRVSEFLRELHLIKNGGTGQEKKRIHGENFVRNNCTAFLYRRGT